MKDFLPKKDEESLKLSKILSMMLEEIAKVEQKEASERRFTAQAARRMLFFAIVSDNKPFSVLAFGIRGRLYASKLSFFLSIMSIQRGSLVPYFSLYLT